MKRISNKRLMRNAIAAETRRKLIAEHPSCMVCGSSPGNPRRDLPRELSQICVHEIANGPLRNKALDKPFACLVLCWYCNQYEMTDKKKWPETRQLAVLLRKSPHHFDLKAYNWLVNERAPNRITIEEVERWF